MKSMAAIASAVVADAIRRKVVWVVLVFAAVLAFAVPALPSYGQGVVQAVFREVTIALMFTAAMVVSIALAATRIPAEIERRTVFTVLARDVRRWQYIAGTWLGMFAVTGLVVLGFTVVALVTGLVVYDALMPVLLQASLAVWLEAGVVMALAVLVSTRLGPVTVTVASLAFLFVGHAVVGLVAPSTNETVAKAPWWLPSLDAFNVINPVAHGTGYSLLYAISMLTVFVAWCGLLLLGASAAFSGRDL